MKKNTVILFLTLLLACLLAGCDGREPVREKGEYYLYYTDINETGLEREVYKAKGTTKEELVTELLVMLTKQPSDSSHMNLLNGDIQIQNYRYEEGNVELDMSAQYGGLHRNKEVLIRAGLVRTMVQIDGVDSVSILVAGEPLTNSKGVTLGKLTESSFVENSGKEINAYQNTTLTLYFANGDGNRLLKENRKLYYSSNVPLERVVVEEIVKGPKTENHFATVPAGSIVLGVTVADGICYVNLGKNFADQALSLQQDIPIYSIVNSLIDNCNVSQVQIAIEGESNYTYRESMDLNQLYTKSTQLIQEDS